MKLDVPTGTTFYWNPYSPKFYTIVQSPTNSPTHTIPSAGCPHNQSTHSCGFLSNASSDDEGSFAASGSHCNSMYNLKPTSPSNKNGSSSNNSFAGQRLGLPRAAPSDDVYNLGWSTISSVRMEKTTDNAICQMVQRFPRNTLLAMVQVIEHSPNLFLELCEKERGNVVSHVIQALQGEGCEELVTMATESVFRLATHQSGCIALTRIYDGCNRDQQLTIALALVQHFECLVCHQFGNFVLSRIAQGTDAAVYEFISAQFEQGEVLTQCLNNKFGSHVFEAFIKNCSPQQLFRVCTVLLTDLDVVMQLATSKIANYPLQNALRTMMTHDAQHELSRWALATIPSLVADTKFAININRALGFGRTDGQQQQAQQQSRKHVRVQ